MAKKTAAPAQDTRLFATHERATERRIRRQRALFIPRFLREAGIAKDLAGERQDKAYDILLRWAALETSGKLHAHRETTIDTQFLDQLFGEGLGYELKTVQPDAYTMEHKFTVTGVGTADAALGRFPAAKSPTVVIELKGARVDLDRDRSQGRTAVQQCWDYMNALPECQWGIVSNFSIIRLYHRTKGSLSYEEFALQELTDRTRFNQFFALFETGGLLPSRATPLPRALALLQKTDRRQSGPLATAGARAAAGCACSAGTGALSGR